jgi:penicillin amidase
MRILGRVALVLSMVVGIAALLIRWRLSRSLPQTQGTLEVSGASSTVRITRDAFGVPTIVGDTQEDAFFGLGFAHAQDRFFQMELQRRTGQGRLSEIAGPRTLELDTLIRKLGIYRAAEVSEPSHLPGSRSILRAYCAGVNAWLERYPDRLPPEFDLLRLNGTPISPAPWRPADSLVWAKMMSLSLSGNYQEELSRADLLDKFGPAKTEELLPPYPSEAPIILGQSGSRWPLGTKHLDPLAAFARPNFPAWSDPSEPLGAEPIEGLGSNNWVIGPSRSTTGYPLLSDDPHLSIQNPSLWYIARLEAPGLSLVGMTLPGYPAVLVGRNAKIAWGVTNLYPDTQDLFVEKVDPNDATRYLTPAGSQPFVLRQESITVAGRKAPVVVSVRETAHGPVIIDGGRGPLALRWTALDPDDTTLDAFLGIDRAASFAEFEQAMTRFVTPAQNFVYADVNGHIGYLAPGRIPIRKSGQGLVPSNGWDGSAEWTGFIPFAELPRSFDPPEGFIVTANNRVVGDSYKYFLGASWGDGYRARRIRELILEHEKVSPADLERIQSDVRSTFARELLPALLRVTPKSERAAAALARLRSWDGNETADSGPGAIFTAWVAHLVPALVSDELGGLYEKYAGFRTTMVKRLLTDPTGAWCDDQSTPTKETCAEISARALEEALNDLSARLGRDPSRWRLSALRFARFENRIASPVPVIGRLFTRTVGIGGDPTTVRVAALSLRRPYDVIALPSFLADFDLSPAGKTKLLVTLGQSGHPLSPNFDDQLRPWARSEPMTIAPVGSSADQRLTLVPKSH